MSSTGRLMVTFVIFYLLKNSNAAIDPEDKTYTATLGTDLTIPWTFDNDGDMSSVDWTFKAPSAATSATVMTKAPVTGVAVTPGYNVEHITNGNNGNIKLKSLTMENTGTYFCTVTYSFSSGLPIVTGTATLSVTIAATSTTTTSANTTTSSSTSTSTTSASTTSTQTSIASSLKSASTTHIIHTTFSRVSSTKSSTSSTKIEKPLTTLPSVDSSSSRTVVIIVVSVVGGLFIIGIVITIILMLLSQQKRRKHVSKGIHTHEDNRNTWKFQRSKSPRSLGHSNHGYIFNGKSTGHQFKQNPNFRRQYNRPITYKYQPRHGNYSQSPYSLRCIYPGFTDGDQYSSRYAGQDRRVNEAPNYYNSCNLRPHYYSHQPNPRRSNSRMPVRETLHTDDQNCVVSDYSVYW